MNNKTYAHYVASLAQKAILYEVSATPKPGLVDRENNGSHSDMDFFTFMSSSSSLYKGIYKCVLTGIGFSDNDLTKLLDLIRPIGIKCEQSMFQATYGVNTHKGIIFSMGVLGAATGRLYGKSNKKLFLADEVCSIAKHMTKGLVLNDFKDLDKKKELSHGEYLYKHYGFKGIRGEAESGFKTILKEPISIIRQWDIHKNLNINDLCLEVLLHIMASSEDTNVMIRGGIESLHYVRDISREFLKYGGMNQKNAKEILRSINDTFVQKNISPGGSADLLAITIFLAMIEGIQL
ncbi:triphosphoribosyl-dephospho-CoA synthase CitG [Sporosalibacterium faouarense]|uniref:triphosphoribosyl-dephospho-CoA synthase CitG n=1 Tax=Sporosalibacterium faouarense TaxID=516123 RepID=UPI00141C950A|nr:triphosphoribosyl-dephospho-CoA synthase CitG [Sporosalibacterium faouarense]MTI47567.1 triphosphoribosyl-dephospho-CoA synthase CitG [Bacillota bacterium]